MRRWQLPAGVLVAVLATQAFTQWGTQIRAQYGSDVGSYEQIARAAPGLPRADVPRQHAERFPAHWFAGTVAWATHVPLHDVYRALTAIALLALLALLVLACRRAAPEPGALAICLALVVASPYPFRYLLAAPGMLSDGVFLVGLAAVLLAFAEERPWLVCAGLALATLGRQSAVPLAIAAALLLVVRGSGRVRFAWATAALAASGAVFAVDAIVSQRFSQPGGASTTGMTVLGAPGGARTLAIHLGRVVLPLLVPAAVIAAAWLRTRRLPPLVPSVLAAAVVLQPVVLAPDWVARNEPRLAGLALPAVALMAAGALRGVRLSHAATAAAAAALVAASLHPRYSDVGVPSTAVWLTLTLATSAAIVSVILLDGRGSRAARMGQPPSISSESTAR